MENFLLYSTESSVTGKALLDALKTEGVKIKGGKEIPDNVALGGLIRWGSTKQIPKRPQRVLNSLKAIQNASDKLGALRMLKEAGIRIPKLVDPANVKAEDFPILGRQSHHVGGKDIVLILQMNDFAKARHSGCTHFTQYIPTKAEYRVHVFGDDVIKTSQKILTDPEQATESWIRNLDAGYTFHSPHIKLSSQHRGMAVDAVAALGLSFGAVDLIVGDDGNAYVLEVNSAPGLIDSGIERYVAKFKEVLVTS